MYLCTRQVQPLQGVCCTVVEGKSGYTAQHSAPNTHEYLVVYCTNVVKLCKQTTERTLKLKGYAR